VTIIGHADAAVGSHHVTRERERSDFRNDSLLIVRNRVDRSAPDRLNATFSHTCVSDHCSSHPYEGMSDVSGSSQSWTQPSCTATPLTL